MAMQSPAAFLQNSSQHSAALFRQAFGSQRYQPGVAHPGDYTVSAQSTPNMSVSVSAGQAWVPGSQVANISGTSWDTQADYFALNDGPVTLTIATADPTNPRIDVVYLAVQDSFYAGSTNQPVLGVVTGTPAPTPTVPALPANALSLAQVSVVAGATSIISSKITQSSTSMLLANTPITCTSSSRPTGIGVGQPIYETDTGLTKTWSGTAWVTGVTVEGRLLAQWETATGGGPSTPTTETLYGFAGGTNWALVPGVAYSLVWEGRLGAGNTAVLATLRIRAQLNGQPTISSPVASGTQKYLAGAGGPFQEDVTTGHRPFQVATAGTYTFGLFGQVPAGSTATLSTLADLRGVNTLSLYTYGPAAVNVRSI